MKKSHDALVELFERIESFFTRLGVHTQVSLTPEMKEVFVNIVSEVLCILSIATKEVKRKRASEFFVCKICFTPDDSHNLSEVYFNKLLGNKEIEDALARLDILINEEVRMVIAQTRRGAQPIQPAVTFALTLFPPRRQDSHRQDRQNNVFVIYYPSLLCGY